MTIGASANPASQTGQGLPLHFPGTADLGAAASSPVSGPVNLHPALEEVRRMKEFLPPQPDPMEEWFNQPWLKALTKQVNELIGKLLQDFLEMLSRLKPAGLAHLPDNIRDAFSGFIVFMMVMIGLYAFYILLGLLLRLRQKKQAGQESAAKVFEDRLLVNSEYHYQQGLDRAGQGHFADGLREVYMATLCLLDETAFVPFEASRSNLDYQEALAGQGKPDTVQAGVQLLPLFTGVSQPFEATHYGKMPVNEALFSRVQSHYQSLLKAVKGSHA